MQTLFSPLLLHSCVAKENKVAKLYQCHYSVLVDRQIKKVLFLSHLWLSCAMKLFHIFSRGMHRSQPRKKKKLSQGIIFPFKFIVSVTVHLTKDVNQFIKGLHTHFLSRVHLSDNPEMCKSVDGNLNRFTYVHHRSNTNRMTPSLHSSWNGFMNALEKKKEKTRLTYYLILHMKVLSWMLNGVSGGRLTIRIVWTVKISSSIPYTQCRIAFISISPRYKDAQRKREVAPVKLASTSTGLPSMNDFRSLDFQSISILCIIIGVNSQYTLEFILLD